MSSQLSDLQFFHLLCAFHKTPDEQVGNRDKSGDLVDQVDRDSCTWSYGNGELGCLRLIMSEFFF